MKIVIFDDMKLSRSVIFAKNILVRIRSIDSAAFQVPIGIVVPKKSDRRDPATDSFNIVERQLNFS